MKKKLYLTPNSYVESDFTPVIEIGVDTTNGSIVATYYDDLSGEICLTDYDGQQFFYRDDGGLKYQIEYLEEAMEEDRKEAQKVLKSKLALYKKAIAILKKEKSKYAQKKKKSSRK